MSCISCGCLARSCSQCVSIQHQHGFFYAMQESPSPYEIHYRRIGQPQSVIKKAVPNANFHLRLAPFSACPQVSWWALLGIEVCHLNLGAFNSHPSIGIFWDSVSGTLRNDMSTTITNTKRLAYIHYWLAKLV